MNAYPGGWRIAHRCGISVYSVGSPNTVPGARVEMKTAKPKEKTTNDK
jgi:hypothetical protein